MEKKIISMTKKPKKSVFLHTHDYEKYLQEESLKIKNLLNKIIFYF